MTTNSKIRLVDKDLKPQFNVTLEQEDEDGVISAVDLDSFSAITLRMRKEDGTRFERDAVIDDAEAGEFHFVWESDDLTTGTHKAEITFTDNIGDETFPDDEPIQLIIRERV